VVLHPIPVLALRPPSGVENGQETMIEGVAIHHGHKTYKLPKPNRHKDILDIHPKILSGTRGFYTDHGEFLDRAKALSHAIRSGQLKGPTKIKGQLHSEDLW